MDRRQARIYLLSDLMHWATINLKNDVIGFIWTRLLLLTKACHLFAGLALSESQRDMKISYYDVVQRIKIVRLI